MSRGRAAALAGLLTVTLVGSTAAAEAPLPDPTAAPAAVQGDERPSLASLFDVHGHLKLQLSDRRFQRDDLAAASGGELDDASFDGRLNLAAHRGRWEWVGQLQVLAADGDSLRLLRRAGEASFLERALTVPPRDDRRSWLDLDHTLTDAGGRRAVARLDRLSVGYTGDHLVLRLGRQALSWGNGLVFNVLDLFDPFAPNAADTEYKPGTDMLWGQWLFASGDDLQALVVPRRDPRDGGLARDESSLAAKWHHYGSGYELELMAAEHYGDRVVGAGTSHDLLGGVGRLDVTWTRLDNGAGGTSGATSTVTSAVANLDHSWLWSGHNVYGFVELHRNGFGSTRLASGVAGLDPALLARLERGEVFTAGRDEVAIGARADVTALTTVEPTLIANAHDGSGLALVHLRHELSDALRVDAGLQLPWGGRGSEYGGLELAPQVGDHRLTGPGRWLWARLSLYW